LIQHRLVQDSRGNVIYDRRDLGEVFREKEMLVLINLSLFLKIRDEKGLALDRSLKTDRRLTRSRGILNSQLTRNCIYKAMRILAKERVLVKVRPEYTIDMIWGMVDVKARWFHSLMDRDDRPGWGASVSARTSYKINRKEPIPAYMIPAWEEKREG
jgi:hypothetical protein